MWEYFKRWVSTAFKHSLGIADLWSGVISAAAAVMNHFWPQIQSFATEALWQVPLWTGFGVIVVRLILAPYWIAKEDAEKIAALEMRLSNRALLTTTGPDKHENKPTNHWRINIHNTGAISANNVQMRLSKISPNPRYGTWQNDYPYPVQPLAPLVRQEVKINPNDVEIYEIIFGWPNGEGSLFTHGLDTKSPHQNYIGIDPDEVWNLTYNITAENADPIEIQVVVHVVNGEVVAERRK